MTAGESVCTGEGRRCSGDPVGSKAVRVEVLNVQETVKKEEAQELYRYL